MADYKVTIKAEAYYDIDVVDAKNIEQAKRIAMKAFRTMKECHGSDLGKPYGTKAKIVTVEDEDNIWHY